jgi:hypothetical protein
MPMSALTAMTISSSATCTAYGIEAYWYVKTLRCGNAMRALVGKLFGSVCVNPLRPDGWILIALSVPSSSVPPERIVLRGAITGTASEHGNAGSARSLSTTSL